MQKAKHCICINRNCILQHNMASYFCKFNGQSSSSRLKIECKFVTKTAVWNADWMQHPSSYRAQPRGLAALRTPNSGSSSASHAHHPVTAATAVEGSSKSSSSLATALAQRPPGGYTALAGGQMGVGEGRDLVAGTGNGRARWVDVDKGVLKADMYCRPLTTAQVWLY